MKLNLPGMMAILLLGGVGNCGAQAGRETPKTVPATIAVRDLDYERFITAHPARPEMGAILPMVTAGKPIVRQLELSHTATRAAYTLRVTQRLYKWGQKPEILPASVHTVPTHTESTSEFALKLTAPNPAVNSILECTFLVQKNGVTRGKLTEAFVVAAAGKGGTEAAFTGRDDRTQGNWLGTYGREAFLICIPNGLSVSQQPFLNLERGYGADPAPQKHDLLSESGEELDSIVTYARGASLDDKRLPQRGPGLENQRPPVAFATHGSPLAFRIEANDGVSHLFSLYLLDFPRTHQTLRADIYDSQRHHLDSRQVADFGEGTYLRYRFRGQIVLVLTAPTVRTFPTAQALFIDP